MLVTMLVVCERLGNCLTRVWPPYWTLPSGPHIRRKLTAEFWREVEERLDLELNILLDLGVHIALKALPQQISYIGRRGFWMFHKCLRLEFQAATQP